MDEQQEIAINLCKGFYNSQIKRIEMICDGGKGVNLDINTFKTWLEDRKNINKQTIMILGVK